MRGIPQAVNSPILHNADPISSGNGCTLGTLFIHGNPARLAAPQASVQEEWVHARLHLPACCGSVEVKGPTHHLSLAAPSETRT